MIFWLSTQHNLINLSSRFSEIHSSIHLLADFQFNWFSENVDELARNRGNSEQHVQVFASSQFAVVYGQVLKSTHRMKILGQPYWIEILRMKKKRIPLISERKNWLPRWKWLRSPHGLFSETSAAERLDVMVLWKWSESVLGEKSKGDFILWNRRRLLEVNKYISLKKNDLVSTHGQRRSFLSV